MRAGRLDRFIDIQSQTATTSDSGEQILTWENFVSRRAASITPVQGSERFINPQVAAQDQIEFRIRYFADVADLSPRDRIIYPAADGSPGDPDPRHVYNILAVNEIGRREGLRIVAVRHADTLAP
jgi:head-tail adaptor